MKEEVTVKDVFASPIDIYEYGIAVEDTEEHPTSLVRIATTKLPIYSGFNLSIVDFEGRSLNERAAQLATVKANHHLANYYEHYDLRYCVISMLYHLNQLTNLYINQCQLWEATESFQTALRGNISDPRPFYEMDAFLGVARRVYESIRKVLWKHYGGATGRWSSIKNVSKSPYKTPPAFVSELLKSWNIFGEKLTNYRDCIVHYDPLTKDSWTTCWMNRHYHRWGMTIKLPSNPESNSRLAFDIDSGPEALSYCHSVACHLVGLCELLESLEKIAFYLGNSPD